MPNNKGKMRNALTNEEFGQTSGITTDCLRDCSRFPATILIDDINKIIVEKVRWGNIAYDYPPSHHIG